MGGDLNSLQDIGALSAYHQMLLDTRNKRYGLWVGISMVFNILELFWFKALWS
jgi:hypothetical protein